MKKALLIALLLSLLTNGLVYAYPPDNAAVIYYKLMNLVEKPNEAIEEQLRNLPTSSEPASKEVLAFIENQKKNFLIQELEVASEIKYCDWGLDVSQGYATKLPHLGKMKIFANLLLADGAIAANRGETSTALNKNLIVRRVANHCSNDDTMIGFLVSLSITQKCNETLRNILATHLVNEATLVELKKELLLDPYRPSSIQKPFIGERKAAILEIPNMTVEKLKEFEFDVSEKDMKRARKIFEKGDPELADRSIKYIEQYFDMVLSLPEKPYIQAFSGYEKEIQKVVEDAKNGNDEAFLPNLLFPALTKCYNHSIRWKTEYHAMLNALDVYIALQKTGKLPEKLTDNSYLDCFSDKPFIYEITKDGFTLRCQQEDLIDKKIQEYTFKLPK